MSLMECRSALVTQFLTVGLAGSPVEYPPMRIDMSVETTRYYTTVHWLPAPETSAELGPDSRMRVTGILQIDLTDKRNQGEGWVNGSWESLHAAFPAGSIYTYNGQDVQVKSTSRRPGYYDGPYWRVPIDVSWTAYIPR